MQVRLWDVYRGISLAALTTPTNAMNREMADILGGHALAPAPPNTEPPDERHALLDASWHPDGHTIAASTMGAQLHVWGQFEAPELQRAPSAQFWASDAARLVHDAHHNALDVEASVCYLRLRPPSDLPPISLRSPSDLAPISLRSPSDLPPIPLRSQVQPHLVPRGPLADADGVAHEGAFQAAPLCDALEVAGLAFEEAAYAEALDQERRKEAADEKARSRSESERLRLGAGGPPPICR